jgi:hypothetical protein
VNRARSGVDDLILGVFLGYSTIVWSLKYCKVPVILSSVQEYVIGISGVSEFVLLAATGVVLGIFLRRLRTGFRYLFLGVFTTLFLAITSASWGLSASLMLLSLLAFPLLLLFIFFVRDEFGKTSLGAIVLFSMVGFGFSQYSGSISELSIPGMLTLKTQVERAKRDANAIEELRRDVEKAAVSASKFRTRISSQEVEISKIGERLTTLSEKERSVFENFEQRMSSLSSKLTNEVDELENSAQVLSSKIETLDSRAIASSTIVKRLSAEMRESLEFLELLSGAQVGLAQPLRELRRLAASGSSRKTLALAAVLRIEREHNSSFITVGGDYSLPSGKKISESSIEEIRAVFGKVGDGMRHLFYLSVAKYLKAPVKDKVQLLADAARNEGLIIGVEYAVRGVKEITNKMLAESARYTGSNVDLPAFFAWLNSIETKL